MILLDKTKISLGGVDVYPDHADKNQFWMVPGAVQLSERDKKTVLSYLWYIDSTSDSNGTGFLNFEVNTAVSDSIQRQITTKLASSYGLKDRDIRLATPTYTKGSVNFSALSGIADKAKVESGQNSVVYSSPDQVVWHAGSSSLVGDNTAVCSVKFTKESGLAALMGEALTERQSVIAATYAMEFTALRPSVSFKVNGTLNKTINKLDASIGVGIPLEAFMLDLGLTGQFVKVMNDMGLDIEVVDYGGNDGKGREWAERIVMDFILRNFFEVGIGLDKDNWTPLKEEPKAETAVKRSGEISAQSEDKSKEEGLDPEKSKENAQKAVQAAMPELPIPKLNIRVAVAHLEQTNTIDFTYSEMASQSYPIAPQSLVKLPQNIDMDDYVKQVNRAAIPFGLPHPVQVAAPTVTTAQDYGLRAINLTATYPASGSSGGQQRQTMIFSDGAMASGTNPMPFQYNSAGDVDVAYDVQYVFDPSSNWQAEKTQYEVKGTTGGAIDVMPAAFLGFVKQDVALAPDFSWYNTDQVLVTIEGEGLGQPVKVVLQKGETEPKSVRLRTAIRNPALAYKVDLMRHNDPVNSYGPNPVNSGLISVLDQFQGHYAVQIFNALSTAPMAVVTVKYQDPDSDFVWESGQIQLRPGQTDQPKPVVVPTPKEYGSASDVQLSYSVMSPAGQYTKEITANQPIFVMDKEG